MRRRDLLAALGTAAAAGLAGCRGYWSDEATAAAEGPWVDTDVPGPIERRSIRFYEPRRNRRVRRLRIAWDPAATAVHLTGVMQYGSSTCDRPGFDRTRYDDDADRLFVRLGPTEREGVDTCSLDLAADTFRATVAFADELPSTVRAVSAKTYDGPGRNVTTAERTVDRAEQRALCTTDHPEGSAAAERAHWTCPERYVRVGVGEPTPTAAPDD